MNSNWQNCKNILCIRADNMGDVIMSGPAIRALKETFNAKITLLTSSMGTNIAKLMNEIDEVITFDFPWVKNEVTAGVNSFPDLVKELQSRNFNAAVIFTVYSQNPMPAIMLAYLADIPKRLAYCRENPYQLLTDWIPDEEPYNFIRHQVRRDLNLVAQVGAYASNEKFNLQVKQDNWNQIEKKLRLLGFDSSKRWLILHAGVSEVKREYPFESWVATGKQLIDEGYQIILTGSQSEKKLTNQLQLQMGNKAFSTGGLFDLDELVTLISNTPVMLSVNTGTVHIAAAVGTPVVVLYALTNPQHTPWKIPFKILPYKVKEGLHSKNEIIKYVSEFFDQEHINMPTAEDIVTAVKELLTTPEKYNNQDLCLIELMQEQIGLL